LATEALDVVTVRHLSPGRYKAHVRHQVESPFAHEVDPEPESHERISVHDIGEIEVEVSSGPD
jgi:hypothetical protein